jgi:elongation factor P hydroxylase
LPQPRPPLTPLLDPRCAVTPWPTDAAENIQTEWLIHHFNQLFIHHNTILVRGEHEPEYLPAHEIQPAQIQFAHGYFASALHEISHWCIAGAARRLQPDLGYWYAPDGRTQEQQACFEQVEIKPQALEWLLTRACDRRFRVSLDNLNGDAGNGERFRDAVYARVQDLLQGTAPIPADAQHLIRSLLAAIRPQRPLLAAEFVRSEL